MIAVVGVGVVGTARERETVRGPVGEWVVLV
jgi:hypothetical protein